MKPIFVCLGIFMAFVFSVELLSLSVWAQVTTTTTLLPQAQSLNSIVAGIPNAIPAWIIGVVVFAVELLMRFVPTAKPRSLLILIGSIFYLLGVGFSKLSTLADSIVQNIKDPS